MAIGKNRQCGCGRKNKQKGGLNFRNFGRPPPIWGGYKWERNGNMVRQKGYGFWKNRRENLQSDALALAKVLKAKGKRFIQRKLGSINNRIQPKRQQKGRFGFILPMLMSAFNK